MLGVVPAETAGAKSIPTLFTAESLHLNAYTVLVGGSADRGTDLCPFFTDVAGQYVEALWPINSRPALYCTSRILS